MEYVITLEIKKLFCHLSITFMTTSQPFSVLMLLVG